MEPLGPIAAQPASGEAIAAAAAVGLAEAAAGTLGAFPSRPGAAALAPAALVATALNARAAATSAPEQVAPVVVQLTVVDQGPGAHKPGRPLAEPPSVARAPAAASTRAGAMAASLAPPLTAKPSRVVGSAARKVLLRVAVALYPASAVRAPCHTQELAAALRRGVREVASAFVAPFAAPFVAATSGSSAAPCPPSPCPPPTCSPSPRSTAACSAPPARPRLPAYEYILADPPRAILATTARLRALVVSPRWPPRAADKERLPQAKDELDEPTARKEAVPEGPLKAALTEAVALEGVVVMKELKPLCRRGA